MHVGLYASEQAVELVAIGSAHEMLSGRRRPDSNFVVLTPNEYGTMHDFNRRTISGTKNTPNHGKAGPQSIQTGLNDREAEKARVEQVVNILEQA